MFKRAIVLLHGFGGQPEDFLHLELQLKSKFPEDTVQVPDLYRQPELSPELNLSRWVLSFEQWLQRERYNEIIVIGYSMGGRLALNWYLTRLSKISAKIIALSSRPGIWDESERKRREDFDSEWAQKFRTLEFSQLNAQWQTLSVFSNSTETSIRTDISRELLALSFENWSPRSHAFDWADVCDAGKGVSWVFGDLDKPYEHVRNLLERESSSPVSVIEGAGHRVLADQPEALCDLLIKQIKAWSS